MSVSSYLPSRRTSPVRGGGGAGGSFTGSFCLEARGGRVERGHFFLGQSPPESAAVLVRLPSVKVEGGERGGEGGGADAQGFGSILSQKTIRKVAGRFARVSNEPGTGFALKGRCAELRAWFVREPVARGRGREGEERSDIDRGPVARGVDFLLFFCVPRCTLVPKIGVPCSFPRRAEKGGKKLFLLAMLLLPLLWFLEGSSMRDA